MVVSIAKLENYPGFLLTIDDTNWWKSMPLPASVETFGEAIYIYGQFHICTAKLVDGTYSIFRTPDNGFTWIQVLNTTENILAICRPDYGVALVATSGGWWRSVDAGKTFTKISVQAPGCICVKELTNDLIVALDGTYIWRTVNGGFDWSKSLIAGTSTPVIAKTSYSTIDGTIFDILIGCTATNIDPASDHGPGGYTPQMFVGNTALLLYSDNAAVSFSYANQQCTWWFREYTTGNTDNAGRFYPLMPRDVWTDIITDIQLSHISSDGTPWFVVQVKMKNGILRHYTLKRNLQGIKAPFYYIMFTVFPKFDSISTLSDSLYCEEAYVTGSNLIQNDIIFSGGSLTAPILMKSSNGGDDWATINIANAKIYSGPDLSQLSSIGGPFTEDTCLLYTWIHPDCHNGWKVYGGYVRKSQSYGMDLLIQNRSPIACIKEKSFDIVISKDYNVDNTYDMLTQKLFKISTVNDILILKTSPALCKFDIVNNKIICKV